MEKGRSVPLHLRTSLTHPWIITHGEADAVQHRLASAVELRPMPVDGRGSPKLAAGVDVAYTKDGTHAWAVAVVMDREFRVVASAVIEGDPDIPYKRGYLAFREGRLTIEALMSLGVEPDLVFCDGHGVVHERGCGLASHVGVLLDVPTIGVPKTPFHAVDHPPGPHRGDHYVLTKEWGAQGASIRLKAGSKQVYVSPGHRTDLDSAIALSLAWSSGRHRVPDPLSAAHTLGVKTRSAAAG